MKEQIDSKRLNRFGPIKGLVLLGGGILLRSICLWAKSERLPVKVITSPRHNDEIVDGESLENFLRSRNVDHISTDDISNGIVKSFLFDTEEYTFLSLGAAWIFKSPDTELLFGERLLNLHGTRLPQNRGGGGFSWQILMGNKFGYCVLHRVDDGIDSGEIVALEEFLYPANFRKPIDFERHYMEKNFNFVVNFIKKYRVGNVLPVPIRQSEYFSSYWPRLNTEINGWINWALDPLDIERFICAFDDPYSGAQTLLNGVKVRIKNVCLSPQDGLFHPYQSGIIYRKSQSWICVALRGSTLVIENLHDESGEDLLSSVNVGDRFITPINLLESSLVRPHYTSKGLK